MGQKVSRKQEEVPPPEQPKCVVVDPGTCVTDMVMETNNKKYKFVEVSNGKFQLSECK